MICNGELSDPLSDSVNRDLTLVRLRHYIKEVQKIKQKFNQPQFIKQFYQHIQFLLVHSKVHTRVLYH